LEFLLNFFYNFIGCTKSTRNSTWGSYLPYNCTSIINSSKFWCYCCYWWRKSCRIG